MSDAITEARKKELLNWLDDKAANFELPYQEIASYRDVAALVRQQETEIQAAWHTGLPEGSR